MTDAGQNLRILGAIASRIAWPVCIADSARTGDAVAAEYDDARVLDAPGGRQLHAWLARAPILALPARCEPSGFAVMDAALQRCALVLGDIDGLREVWDGAAVFVDPEDADELAATLARLIADSGERHRLAGLARARACQRTPQAMACAYAAAYARITAGMMAEPPRRAETA